jgi:hypothetical protein
MAFAIALFGRAEAVDGGVIDPARNSNYFAGARLFQI